MDTPHVVTLCCAWAISIINGFSLGLLGAELKWPLWETALLSLVVGVLVAVIVPLPRF